jgi:putrescine transport system substrate-binding protein
MNTRLRVAACAAAGLLAACGGNKAGEESAGAAAPGNEHAVGYMWRTTGIGYDARKVMALAPDAPTDSWRLVFDPAVAKRLAPCGIAFVDAPSEILAVALMSLGKDPYSSDPADLAAAEAALLAIRPYVRYVIPSEGTLSWFDTLAIPKDASNPDEAHAFIHFMLTADTGARNATVVRYATFNRAALPMMDAALTGDPSMYPALGVRARLRVTAARSLEDSRVENRIWTRFRTGR